MFRQLTLGPGGDKMGKKGTRRSAGKSPKKATELLGYFLQEMLYNKEEYGYFR